MIETFGGDVISDELLKAIDESMFAITVLSPNYATSAWCLDELRRIVKRSKDRGLVIMPIFYDVEPSDVRYQNKSFEEAFKKHERRFGQDSKKVRRWRRALKKVAGCSGWNSKDEDEAELVESIAQDIHNKLIPKLPKLPSWTETFVWIRSKVEDVYSLLGKGLDVCFIGIWGMGGIGKTTIARAIFEAIPGDFKVRCFLDNIREACDKGNIIQKQQELVAHVNISANSFHNKYDGRRIIQNSLCHKKVLLVIDDVNEESQLEDLAGKDWFGHESRIIITTRNKHLLEIHGVHCYKVERLIQNEALQLFSLKAFKQDRPKEGFLDLSNKVVNYSGGLPLALEILGSFLCGRTIEAWQSGVKKIRSVQHSKIHDKLKISFDDLDSTQKNIFLDIACFFKRMTKDYVIDILEKCDHNPQIEIDVLTERSLITLSKEDTLEMHDLIEEMGRNIVIQEFLNDPSKRSRLWSKVDIDCVLTKNKGTEAIQGIVFPRFYEGSGCAEAFSNMNQLKLLKVYGVELPYGLGHLPISLKVLHWEKYPLETLSLGHEMYEVVDIKLQDSSKIEKLCLGRRVLEKLRNLELIDCIKLYQLPIFSDLPNLEKIRLVSCSLLTEVDPSFIRNKKLVVLDLSNCSRLKTFPGELIEMSSLKELILDYCKHLEKLPKFGECMQHLSRLSLKHTALSELPTSIGCLVGLEELILTGCKNLVCLPDTIYELKSLRILEADWCESLERFPSFNSHVPFCHGKKLGLEKMKNLDLLHCEALEQMPDLSAFPNLEKLRLASCFSVTEVHPSLIHHKKLVVLDLRYCGGLKTFPGKLEMSFLTELILNGCKGLENIPEFGECMKHLSRLSLTGMSISQLPTSLGCLVGLEELILESCEILFCLPDIIHELKSLRILEVEGCKNLNKLPSSLSRVPFLSSLNLSDCGLTGKEFPPSLDFCHFPALMELGLARNPFVSIPIHIHRFPKLRNLKLKQCRNLRSLPELPSSIRELDARHCDSLNISELLKACSVFASSPNQDHGQVLQMLITGKEIPSWFVHQEVGNCVSIPLQHDSPQHERLGIALCFQIPSFYYYCPMIESGWRLDVRNGKRIITKVVTNTPVDYNLYILYLSKGYFSNEIHPDKQFELLTIHPKDELNKCSSGARWIYKQDVEDLKKEKRKRKRKRNPKKVKVEDLNENI